MKQGKQAAEQMSEKELDHASSGPNRWSYEQYAESCAWRALSDKKYTNSNGWSVTYPKLERCATQHKDAYPVAELSS
jgi:hypothetical protein